MKFTSAFVLAALPYLVNAVPSPASKAGRLEIPISKRAPPQDVSFWAGHVNSVKNKYLRNFAAFERNTGSKHPLAASLALASRRGNSAVQLTDNGEILWYDGIAVGTPPKTFTVDFDTGSSDLVLPGTDCTANCEGHTLYDPSWSSTSEITKQPFKLSYGDGSSVQGTVFLDTVALAGFQATNQSVGDSSQYSDGFSLPRFPSDGLMGMAFKQISEFNASPVFQTLVEEGMVSDPVFAFRLGTSGSKLDVGGIDQASLKGDISYTNVIEEGFWQVKTDALKVGGQTTSSNFDAIIDSGTTLIVGPTAEVAKLYEAAGGMDASQTVGPGMYTSAFLWRFN